MENEQVFSPETKDSKKTKVILEFMRHGEKENDKTKKNEDMMLTAKGKAQAREKGQKLKPQLEVSVGRGSLRKRTEETVMHAMLSGQDEVKPEASLAEMEKLVAREMKYGKKSTSDPRLDFDFTGPSGNELLTAFKAGKGVYLEYLVDRSDQRAIEAGDKTSTTYLRFAGNVAEIVDRYLHIGDKFNQIAAGTDKYEKFGNQLERYFGSHQGIVESFLAKILEKQEGDTARDEFIKSVGAGFQEMQGIRVEIMNDGDNQSMSINYEMPGEDGKNFEKILEIDPKIIREIIDERDNFEKNFND